VCNWLAEVPGQRCLACAANTQIPDLSVRGNLVRWAEMESAKRRLYYSILQLGLADLLEPGDGQPGLRFAFLASTPQQRVVTGHDNGLITIDIAEAEEITRTQRRVQLGEDYRTLVGHLRHESGHYFWSRLIDAAGLHAEFREAFGDERADYGQALATYYDAGPPGDWSARYITGYASAHPHEDWAESFAHYLHIYDTTDTARHLEVADPEVLDDFQELLEEWMELSIKLNLLSRSMGYRDMYPFVLSEPVRAKLAFVHALLQRHAAAFRCAR
jgi:hypothetical protein